MRILSRNAQFYCLYLLALVLIVQMFQIQRPYVGHYASYQATVMASIARNMVRENFSDLLNPKTDTLISGKKALHLNQYPLPSVVAAIGLRVFGGTLEFWGRFQAILFNLLTMALLVFIVGKLFSYSIAWIALAVYALSPYTLIYGQAFMSESIAIFFLFLCFYLLLPTSNHRLSQWRLIISALMFSISIIGRVHFFIFYPLCLLLIFFSSVEKKVFGTVTFTLVALLLPTLWYGYTYFASMRVDNVHTNIFLQLSSPEKNPLNFLISPDYYRRIFDDLSRQMLTPLLFPFALLGFGSMVGSAKWKNEGFWFTIGGIVLGILFILFVPQKVVKHDFYLYGFFPFLCILTAKGLAVISESFPSLRKPRTIILLVFIYFMTSARFFLHPIFSGSNEERNVLRIARSVKAQTHPEDRLIVAAGNPGALLYYVDRPVMPLQFSLIGKDLAPYQKNEQFSKVNHLEQMKLERAMKNPFLWVEYLRGQEAQFLVTTDKKELESVPGLLSYLSQKYELISLDSEDFYFFRLTPKSQQ